MSERQRTAAGPKTPMRLAALALMTSAVMTFPVTTRAGSPDVPALIVNPTVESRRELERVIHKALGNRPVTLADDALTGSSLLSLEHALRRDREGRALNGRDLSRPDTFELVLRGPHCVLVRLKTGASWKLHRTTCVAAPVRSPPTG